MNQTVDPRRWRLPLLLKMLILILGATLVPLIIFGAMSIKRGGAAVSGTARHNLQLIASLTATQLDQLFIDTQRLQGVIANSYTVMDACAPSIPSADQRKPMLLRVQEQLNRVLTSNPDIALAYLADEKGICLVSTSPDMVGRNYKATRLYMQRALTGEQYISELAMGITTREPGVFFSGPVRSADNAIIGAVVLKLKGEVIDRICGNVNTSLNQGFAGVLDAEQVIISHPNRQMLYRSLGKLSPEATARINPKLQYGIERVESAGLEDMANILQQGQARGNLGFTSHDGIINVAGFARMSQRPWTITVVQPRAEFDRPIRQLAQSQKWAIGVVGLLSLIAAALATYALLRPVNALRKAALRAAQGDWSARAKVLSRDELGDLAHTFNDMMPKLQERAKMQDALRLAMEIQHRLLPDHSPPIAGLEVAGVNLAADETGGDYFDFIDLSSWQNGTLAVAIGDVTGHGISAALLMATARGLLRSQATPPGTLAGLMNIVNERLCDDTPDGRFMTLMYALIDRPQRKLRLVSAGHDPVIAYVPGEDRFEEFEGEDLPVGIQRDWHFHEVIFSIPEDSILFFGTDGIWETFSPDHEAFGKDRLKEVIRAHRDSSAAEIKDAVILALSEFRGSEPQQDDVTIVVIRLTPVDAAVSSPILETVEPMMT